MHALGLRIVRPPEGRQGRLVSDPVVGAESTAVARGNGKLPQRVQAVTEDLPFHVRCVRLGGQHEEIQELRAAVHRAKKRRDARHPLEETHGPNR